MLCIFPPQILKTSFWLLFFLIFNMVLGATECLKKKKKVWTQDAFSTQPLSLRESVLEWGWVYLGRFVCAGGLHVSTTNASEKPFSSSKYFVTPAAFRKTLQYFHSHSATVLRKYFECKVLQTSWKFLGLGFVCLFVIWRSGAEVLKPYITLE